MSLRSKLLRLVRLEASLSEPVGSVWSVLCGAVPAEDAPQAAAQLSEMLAGGRAAHDECMRVHEAGRALRHEWSRLGIPLPAELPEDPVEEVIRLAGLKEIDDGRYDERHDRTGETAGRSAGGDTVGT